VTAKERAAEATWDTGAGDWTTVDREYLEKRVEQAIIAAVEAEREACADLARKAAGNHPNELKRETARDIEALIRARSTASSTPQAD
jgi:hypothetical protein